MPRSLPGDGTCETVSVGQAEVQWMDVGVLHPFNLNEEKIAIKKFYQNRMLDQKCQIKLWSWLAHKNLLNNKHINWITNYER